MTTDPAALRPGDTLVVPSSYGGIRNGTWDPDSEDVVEDIALMAALEAGYFRLRLNPAVLEPFRDVDGPTAQQRHHQRGEWLLTAEDLDIELTSDRVPTPAYVQANALRPVDVVRSWLFLARERLRFPDEIADRVQGELALLASKLTRANIQEVASEWGPVYVLTRAIGSALTSLRGDTDIDSEPWRSSNVGEPYGLSEHSADVGRWAGAFAKAVGVPAEQIRSLMLAGELHDLGKSDPRFQAILREGELDFDGRLLAKSAIPPQDRGRADRARRQSGYPPGLRHELTSVALLADADVSDDPALVRRLIASHHGYARPFAPVQLDDHPVKIHYEDATGLRSASSDHGLGSVGSEIGDNFWKSLDRYGVYGLAWLETILRLADHGASRTIATAHPDGAK